MAVSPSLPRPTEMAHRLLQERIQFGDTVIDATAGNGHDTLFLANCVGSEGLVIGLDLQESAIEKTRERTNHLTNVQLHCLGHEQLDQVISSPVSAITFNLGFLPSGDKSVITRKETTLAALDKSLSLLAEGGLLTLVAYIGHAGGIEEGDAVSEWAAALDQEDYSSIRYEFQNQRNSPPYLIAVERRAY